MRKGFRWSAGSPVVLLVIVLLSGWAPSAAAMRVRPLPAEAGNPAAPPSGDFESLASLGGFDGRGYSVAVSGTTVYLALGNQIALLNASNPAEPVRLGSISIAYGGYVSEMLAVGSTLYVAQREGGLLIFNVSNPAAPALLFHYESQDELSELLVSGNRAYVTHNNLSTGGILIFDVSNPASPTLLRDFALPCSFGLGLDLAGTTLYAATSCGLQIISVAAPQNPLILGSYPGHYDGVAVSNGVAYTIDVAPAYRFNEITTFRAINVSNPANPVLLHEDTTVNSTHFTHSNAIAPWLAGQFVVMPNGGLDIINVSNPSAPVRAKHLPAKPLDMALNGALAYVLDESGLTILDLSAPAAPLVRGGYTLINDVTGMKIVGSTMYTFGLDGVQLVDIANPRQPRVLGRYPAADIEDIEVAGPLIYAAGQDFRIIDASNQLSPTLRSIIPNPLDTLTRDIELAGDTAYLANNYCAPPKTFQDLCDYQRASHMAVDISNPSAPQIVKRFDYPLNAYGDSYIRDMELAGGWMYSALWPEMHTYNPSAGTQYVHGGQEIYYFEIADQLMVATNYTTMTVYDISDPQELTALGSLALPGGIDDI
ncbi:MAG TPA: hypothetical protein VD886_06305, partial [Herpetosiphonaceae bacterium]|nr:hypothetical protein [Herpetosiphonaceae bacterium]